MNKTWESIQGMKTEFNKEIELLKRNQTEKILEMKNSISQIQMSVESVSNGKDRVGNLISGLEDNVEKSSVDKLARKGTDVKEMESEWQL